MTYLIVFLGGGIGAALRHGVNLGFARAFGTAFPYATMFENVTGSQFADATTSWPRATARRHQALVKA